MRNCKESWLTKAHIRKEKTLRDLLRQTVGFNPFPKKITEEEVQKQMHETTKMYKVGDYIKGKKEKISISSRLRGGQEASRNHIINNLYQTDAGNNDST